MTKPIFFLPIFWTLLSSSLLLPGLSFSQDFYGSEIQEIRITIPHDDWDFKLDSLKKNNPDNRLSGDAVINGTTFRGVGIRYKGNSSYFRTRNETYRKLPFNIKLNFTDKKASLPEGKTSVKLSNAFMDPSFIRDPLSFEIIRNYMPAPRCNFTRLYVNKDFYGLYINTESIDEDFIEQFYGTDKGYLIKCDPHNWKRIRSQSGCPKGENASLYWLGDNPGCYDAFYEVDDAAGWQPLLNLMRTLNKNPAEIESVLNVDQALWMLALNNALVNLDSYNGSLSHNYYIWFDTTGVGHPLIWDLNMSFGGWRRDFSFKEMSDQEMIEMHPLKEINNPKRPLISQLLKDPYYRKIYMAHYKTICEDYLFNGALLKRAEEMLKTIEPWVEKDTLKLYSLEDFKNSMDKTMVTGPDHVIGIRQLMQKRAEWLKTNALIVREQPQISEVKHQRNGARWLISAHLQNGNAAWLYFRHNKGFAFKRVVMHDDGKDGDAAAGDGIYSALVEGGREMHYYIAAENEGAGATLPARASFEYLKTQ